MSEEKKLEDFLKDFDPHSSELKRFTSEEMLNCEKCGRANAPTRTNCLYCGSALPVVESAKVLQKPKLKKLEDWELGFNVILLPAQQNDFDFSEVANYLGFSTDDLKSIVSTREPIPVARTENASEAELMKNNLSKIGCETTLVSDWDLAVNDEPKRLRGVIFSEENFVGRTLTNELALNVAWEDIRLIVVGRTFEKRIETEEKISRKEVKELADSRELSTDKLQLDLYCRGEKIGWRISADKFDFSCLGVEKGLTVAENITKFIKALREHATQAVFDDSFNRVHSALNTVWQIESKNESLGLRRKNFGQAVTQHANVSSNENQFLRYSRLKAFFR